MAHGRVELLAHPLSQKYLQMKWNSYGKYFHLANLLFYCIYLTFVTMHLYMLIELVETPHEARTACVTNSSGLSESLGSLDSDVEVGRLQDGEY